MAAVIERVASLERTVQDFVRNTEIQFNRLYNSQLQTEAELRLFKDETHRQHREMNKKWGEFSNKLGTLVEDLVDPSLPRVVEKRLNERTYDLMMRRKRRSPDGRVKEFDAVLVTLDCVCLNSTKATLSNTDVDGFVADIAEFRTFFPEYNALPLVGILASLAMDGSVLAYAERQGFLVLAVGDELSSRSAGSY